MIRGALVVTALVVLVGEVVATPPPRAAKEDGAATPSEALRAEMHAESEHLSAAVRLVGPSRRDGRLSADGRAHLVNEGLFSLVKVMPAAKVVVCSIEKVGITTWEHVAARVNGGADQRFESLPVAAPVRGMFQGLSTTLPRRASRRGQKETGLCQDGADSAAHAARRGPSRGRSR